MTLLVAGAVVALATALRQSAPPPRRGRRPVPSRTTAAPSNDISVAGDDTDISVTPGR